MNYLIFAPEKVINKTIEIEGLGKKEIKEVIENSMDEKLFKNEQFSYYKSIDKDKIFLTSFQDKVPIVPKSTQALIPIYSIFRKFTKVDNVIRIFASVNHGTIAIFFGDEFKHYTSGLDSELDISQQIKTDQSKYNLNFAGQRIIKIYTDVSFDNIETEVIELDELDPSKDLQKTEILVFKSKIDLMLEKINIKVSFNLSLSGMVKILLQLTLLMGIFTIFYLSYEQNKKLTSFYDELEQNMNKNLNNFNDTITAGGTGVLKPVKDSVDILNENLNNVSKTLVEQDRNVQNLIKQINNSNADIRIIKSNTDNSQNKIDIMSRELEDLKRKLNDITTYMENSDNRINNASEKIKESLENTLTNITPISTPTKMSNEVVVIPEKKVEIKEKLINYEVLIRGKAYLKVKIDNNIYRLRENAEIPIYNGFLFKYTNGKLYINNKFYDIENNGVLNVK